MGDPRNVAQAKKVSQEKHHKEKHAPKAGPAPSQRAKNVQTETKAATESTAPKAEAPKPTQPVEPAQLEKSLVVLSKLKELEFHSRANIEKLAELSLTIEEELKQKAFAEAIGAVYAAQNAFQSKILKLIEDYEAVRACVGLCLMFSAHPPGFDPFRHFFAHRDEHSVSNNPKT